MDLFETLTGFLKGAVGNNMGNAPEDVLTVKRGLSRAGYYDTGEAPEPHGYLTKAMDESIRNFQKDNNLRVDGTLLPGGETERSLYEATTGRSADEAFGRARNENAEKVGFGGNITGMIAHIAVPQRELLRASQTQPAPRTDVTRSARDSSEEDALPAGSFGHPAQNVDATGRAIREKSVTLPDSVPEKTYSNTDFLEHYKKGSGAPVTITSKEMDAMPLFKKGIEQNRKSFENSILKGEVTGDEGTFKSPFKTMIENMRDGETLYLDKGKVGAGDYWDQDIKRWDAAKSGDIKQSIVLGSAKLRSQGRLKAERHGDKILITGTIDHKVSDTYNFNKEDWLLNYGAGLDSR